MSSEREKAKSEALRSQRASKEKVLTVADMRENLAALTSICQLLVKQQALIVDSQNRIIAGMAIVDQKLDAAVVPVEAVAVGTYSEVK